MEGSKMHTMRGFTEMDRFVPVTNEDGEALHGTASTEVVKSQDIAFKRVDAEGGSNTDELDPETTSESLEMGGKELFEKYLEIIFRDFPGEILRVSGVSDRAIADRANLTQGKGEYIYMIPASLSDKMKSSLEQPVSFGVDDPGVEFSQMTGLSEDILDQNGLGFTRKMQIDGQFFTVKFLYGKEKSHDKAYDHDVSMGVEDKDFGGINMKGEDKKEE